MYVLAIKIIYEIVTRMIVNTPLIKTYDLLQGDVKSVEYPTWCYFIIAFLICASCLCIPAVFLLRLYQRVTARRRRDTEIVRDLLESSTTKKPAQETAD